MQYTTNLNLKKPEATDLYDIGNENDNMDVEISIVKLVACKMKLSMVKLQKIMPAQTRHTA